MVWEKKDYTIGFQPISMDTDTKMKNATAVIQTSEANVVRDIVFSSSTSIEDMTSHHKTTHICC